MVNLNFRNICKKLLIEFTYMYILSAICEKKIQNIDTYGKIDLNRSY